jgi:hypothetical protein
LQVVAVEAVIILLTLAVVLSLKRRVSPQNTAAAVEGVATLMPVVVVPTHRMAVVLYMVPEAEVGKEDSGFCSRRSRREMGGLWEWWQRFRHQWKWPRWYESGLRLW